MSTTPTLRHGSKGAAVTRMQNRLRAHGHSLKADGSFGPLTVTAVRAFQSAKKLKVDGVVGPASWTALNKAPAVAGMALTEAGQILTRLGWRTNTVKRRTQAIEDFQRMYNLAGAPLGVDGIVGPATTAALRESDKRNKAKQNDISANFKAREFACRCGGSNTACDRIWATRTLVQAAEKMRTLIGPFTPYRACRCPVENRRVGGAAKSQHLFGSGLDFGTEKGVYNVTVAQVKNLGVFSGIGYYTVGGRQIVRHGDTRHDSPTKTAGTVTHPGLWSYGTFGNRHTIPPRPTK